MTCAVCLSMPSGYLVREAMTIVNGTAVCELHLEWVGLPRAMSSRINRMYEIQKRELEKKEKTVT